MTPPSGSRRTVRVRTLGVDAANFAFHTNRSRARIVSVIRPHPAGSPAALACLEAGVPNVHAFILSFPDDALADLPVELRRAVQQGKLVYLPCFLPATIVDISNVGPGVFLFYLGRDGTPVVPRIIEVVGGPDVPGRPWRFISRHARVVGRDPALLALRALKEEDLHGQGDLQAVFNRWADMGDPNGDYDCDAAFGDEDYVDDLAHESTDSDASLSPQVEEPEVEPKR